MLSEKPVFRRSMFPLLHLLHLLHIVPLNCVIDTCFLQFLHLPAGDDSTEGRETKRRQ